jgi:methylthioribose-1-phosphate isomerase
VLFGDERSAGLTPAFAESAGVDSVWFDGDAVGYLDQRALPGAVVRERARTVEAVVEAIATLAVRGAPAIGIFGAYGTALASQLHAGDRAAYHVAAARIRAARPTAVNLAWAVDRVLASPGAELAEAQRIHDQQRDVDRRIGEAAVPLFPSSGNVLTHCNTGPIATGGDGTALGCFVAAHRAGKQLHVFVDETRPLLQGARLTMFELHEAGVPCTLIVDSAAAITMQRKAVRAVVVGADRIARNGDTANKIGTYGVAIAAAHHGIPFYVAAPRSTFDFALESGDQIPIEERSPDEVRIAVEDAVYNPAFDVTPGRLIAGFITEYGVLSAPYTESIADLEHRPNLSSLVMDRAQ